MSFIARLSDTLVYNLSYGEAPKFYFFDLGVKRALERRLRVDLKSFLGGRHSKSYFTFEVPLVRAGALGYVLVDYYPPGMSNFRGLKTELPQ